jgi:hypothetical protein
VPRQESWSFGSYVVSLSSLAFGFLICKMGTLIIFMGGAAVLMGRSIIHGKHLE